MKRGRARWLAPALCGAIALASAGWPAPAPAQAVGPLPPFTLFGWLSPPPESTTTQRIAEMAELGLNVLLPSQDPAGHAPEANLRRLDLAAQHNLQVLLFDERLGRAWRAGFLTPAGAAVLDSVVNTYRDHPGFLGWYLGDEPRPPYDTLAVLHRELQRRDPRHMTWNNLLGRMAFASEPAWRAYIDGYLDTMPARVLSDDHYEFLAGRDRNQFFVNAAGLRDLADQHGVPFWAIVQLTQHTGYRALTSGELRWQVSNLLAYGARGIGYFTYWTPSPDPQWNWGPGIIGPDGHRTGTYDMLKAFHQRLRPAGELLASCRWNSTQATAPVPPGAHSFVGDDWLAQVEGRASIGRFVDHWGRPHLVIVNRDSLAEQQISLIIRGATGVTRLDGLDGPSTTQLGADPVPPYRLALPAGDFALLRIEGTEGQAVETLGPVMVVLSQPSRGVAQFDLMRVGAGAKLTIFDATGRALWETPLLPGDRTASWNGIAGDGRRMPPGIYFAQLRDNRGTATTRAVWLGP
jgi:hypothetical protein